MANQQHSSFANTVLFEEREEITHHPVTICQPKDVSIELYAGKQPAITRAGIICVQGCQVKNRALEANTSDSPTGMLQHPASLTRCSKSLLHTTTQCLEIQDMHHLHMYFTKKSSHLPKASRCKLSLTSSLSSSHMEVRVKPTSRAQIRAKFNINLHATSELNSDVPPLHSYICSIGNTMLLPCLCTPATGNGNWKQLSSKFKSS